MFYSIITFIITNVLIKILVRKFIVNICNIYIHGLVQKLIDGYATYFKILIIILCVINQCQNNLGIIYLKCIALCVALYLPAANLYCTRGTIC